MPNTRKSTRRRRKAPFALPLLRLVRALAPLALLALLPIAVPGLLAESADQGQPQGSPAAQAQAASNAPCAVAGVISAGPAHLPGVTVTVTPQAGGTALTTSTGIDGKYLVTLPGPGKYALKAELAAFAPVTKEVSAESPCQVRLDFPLTLASRVPTPAPAPAGAAAAVAPKPAAGAPPAPVQGAGAATSKPQAAGTQAAGQRAAGGQRQGTGQFQRVGAAGTAGQQGQATDLTVSTEDTRAVAERLNLPPGFTPETMTDTVTAFGRTGQTNEMLLFGPGGMGMFGGREGMPAMPGLPSGMGGEEGAAGAVTGFSAAPGGPGGGGRGGEAGGVGGGGGGRGGEMGGFGGMGGRGGGPGGGGGGRGGGAGLGDRLALANRMQQDRPRGGASYQVGGSPFDAAPYSLTGNPVTKPDYLQQRFTGSIGGQFKIPGLFDLGSRTSYFLNYSGNRSSNFSNAYSTVPTEALRNGDFSAFSTVIRDPLTLQPFDNNTIPQDRIDPSAKALLKYIPLPNQVGDRLNYYYSTTNSTSGDDINFRFVRTFGTQQRGGRGGARGGGGGGGGRGGGGPGGGAANLNVSVHWTQSSSTQNGSFPTLSGSSKRTGWDIPVSFGFTAWKIVHSLRGGYNLNNAETTNAYAYVTDVAGAAGITGVSTDPFDWGVPSISFSTFSGLRDVTPSLRKTQTITFSDSMTRMWKRHNFRWGLDYRRDMLDSRVNSNPRGSYVFTGLFTGLSTSRGSGTDFADFLLGLPQQASVNYGPGTVRLRSNAISLYFQDDWRVSTKFTLNLGARYEYQSPYSESGNNLVNLDTPPDFSAAVPVLAGQVGPYTGVYPLTIINPDRNNISPRLGFAWRASPKTVVRGGYGINYSSVPYLAVAQKLSAQPPFATTDTRSGTFVAPLSLSDAFGAPATATTTNNFAVDKNYRIGYVQMWNVDIQRDITRTLNGGISYTGTKGDSLDILRAPNRGPTGTTINGVQAFTWESSGAQSFMNSFSARLRKRLAQGLQVGGTYTFSHSRDDASSLSGGGGGTVAQNDKDLAAEWGPSSFDVRHRLAIDFAYELPFGPNRRWLNKEGWAGEIFGGWMLNGNLAFSSGSRYTARVTGAVGDVAGGVNGTLRANYNGQPIALDNPTVDRFFNTAAFSVPIVGTYGNSTRNLIVGPPQHSFNMSLQKNFTVRGTRGVSLRIQANNVFNQVVWGSIDTTVNSPTFGHVTSVRSMRSMQIILRMNF